MASASGVDHSDAAHLVDQERRRAPLNMIANIGVSAAGHYGLRKQGLSPAATICRPGHVLSAQIDALNHPAATTDTHVSDRQAIFEAPFPTPQFAVVRQTSLRLLGVQGMRLGSRSDAHRRAANRPTAFEPCAPAGARPSAAPAPKVESKIACCTRAAGRCAVVPWAPSR